MNIAVSVLTSGLVGAGIGALTNDLAVRWIFRILIPGKKGEMAVAVRDVVANDLMAPEKVAEKLRSPEVRRVIEQNLRSSLDHFLELDLPSPNRIMGAHRAVLDSASARLETFIADESCANLFQPDRFRADIIPLIESEIGELLSRSPGELVPPLDALVDSIPARTHAYLLSDGCRERFASFALSLLTPLFESERPLREHLPPSVIREISEFFARQGPLIVERIADYLETPASQKMMRHAIRAALDDYVSRATPSPVKRGGRMLNELFGVDMGAALMRAAGVDTEIKSICRSFPETMRSESAPGGVRHGMESMVEHLADDFLDTPIRDLHLGFDPDKWRSALVDAYPALVTPDAGTRIGTELQNMIADTMRRNVGETIERLRIPLDRGEIAELVAARLMAALRSPAFVDVYRERVGAILRSISDRDIGRIGDHLPDSARLRLAELAGDLVSETVAARFEDFAGQCGIWDTIIESIERYDDREIEQVVRKIADRELRWVTIMGGILGFLIGIVQGWLFFVLNKA